MRDIFFDLVGTLIRPRGSVGTQYTLIASRFGIAADRAAIDEVVPVVLPGLPAFALPDPADPDLEAREKRAWRTIVESVFRQAGLDDIVGSTVFDAYFEALFGHFASRDAWELFPDVLPALADLERRRYRIGLITNFDGRVFPLLDSLGLASTFDSVTIPALAGAAKPDGAIFRHALGTHGAKPEDTVYVGDSLTEDIVPARTEGVAAVLIDRDSRQTPPSGVMRIESLDRLDALLRAMGGR